MVGWLRRHQVPRFSIPKIAVTAIFGILAACTEGTFELAKESRLPIWFHLPQGTARDDVTVTMDMYAFPTEKAVLTLKGKGGVTISVVTAHRVGGYNEPKQLQPPPAGYPEGYPSYEVLTSGDEADILEFRRMEPIFYASDDASVWKEFGPRHGR